MKVKDAFTDNGYLRPDGRMVHDVYLVQVKTPAESTTWGMGFSEAGGDDPRRRRLPTAGRRRLPRARH